MYNVSVINWEKLSKAQSVQILLGDSLSLEIRALLSSRYIVRTSLTEGFYDLFQGRKASGGGGQSYFPTSAIFSNSFKLKYSICQGAIVWVSMS